MLLEIMERAVPLNEIHIPGDPSPSQRWRWRTQGIKSVSGRIVKLRTWHRGLKVVTTPEAIEQFFQELNAPASEANE